MTQLLLVLFVVSLGLSLWVLYHRHKQEVINSRAGLLSQSDKVIQISKSVTDKAGLSYIRGRFADMDVSLEIEIGTHSSRKQADTWLHITMYRLNAGRDSLDILAHPQTSDVFSPGWNWSRPVTPLKSWPKHARYMSRDKAPVLKRIDSDVRTIFADQQVKGLLVLPEAIRLTYLIKQKDSRDYRLLGSAGLGIDAVDSAQIAALIRQLQNMVLNLDSEGVCRAAA